MRIKTFAMFAVFLTASIACVAPALAEDTNSSEMPMPMEQSLAENGGTSLQPPADNSNVPSSMDNSAQSQASNASQNGVDANIAALSPSSPTASNSDEGTPDAATGDDDY